MSDSPKTPYHSILIQLAKNSEFIVYSRKKEKTREGIEEQTQTKQVQEYELSPQSIETPPGNTNSKSHELLDNDLDLPIALWKGVRSCTNHPIYNFVSYKGLSPGFRVFVTNLNKIQIPNNIQEALKLPEWRAAVWEEI